MKPVRLLAVASMLFFLPSCSAPGAPDAGGGGTGGGAAGGSAGGVGGGSAGGTAGGTGGGAAGGTGGGSAGGAGGGTAGGSGGGSGDAGLWTPRPGASWQLQLSGTIDTTVDAGVYDIDLFEAPQATIDTLHAQGRKVICYFSAGSSEDWRPDFSQFPSTALGNDLVGWPGERWLDTRDATVRTIMRARLDLAVQKRCDGVDPDNVDGYLNSPGFPLTAATQLDFNRFLAAEAHARGMAAGLKNGIDLIPQLVGDFEWELNEQCLQYNECATLAPFIQANKAVFHVEYGAASLATTVCPQTRPLQFSTLIKNLNLDAWRVACP